MRPFPLYAVACLLASVSAMGASNYNQPLDRPFTLRNPDPLVLEREYGRTLRGGGPLSYVLPRPCLSPVESSRVCGEPHGLSYTDAERAKSISFSPQAGYEYRYLGENVHSAEMGLLASGHAGALSFHLDTRMFTELHEDFGHASYDREYLEKQDASASGSLAYTSYSRYRAHVAYDFAWGRLTAGKDAVHWGPGLYQNLAFSQDAIPFRNLTFTSSIGPFTVVSLYGSLLPGTDWETDLSGTTRSLYAHRYELRLGRDWVVGVSEQLVLHDAEAPFAFLPIIPLFIAKAEEKEALNNGNLAADLTWRIRDRLRLYSEFFLDDMQSPTSLFDDSWGNKWAWMAGAHWTWSRSGLEGGAVAEYARIEPWVYTHYRAHTAQTAHFDHPLGNQAGPNSQSVTLKTYLGGLAALTASVRMDLRWKGRDAGSGINDEFFTTGMSGKRFLDGSGGPDVTVTPSVAYAWNRCSLGAWTTLGARATGAAALFYRY